MRQVPALLGLLAMVALSVAACGSSSSPLISAGPSPLLVTVEARGGECPDGMCSTRYDIYRDGRVVRSDGAVDAIGDATAARLAELIAAADWDAILARPFTGQCPTAYDGQELVYTFQVPRGEVVAASCTVQIDAGEEPFETLAGVLFGARE